MRNNFIRALAAAFATVLGTIGADAQIWTNGNDPGSLGWSQIRTEHYRIVYPRGLDSLARLYAVNLERWLPLEAASSGFAPGQNYRKATPVILHAYSSTSNGSVTWAPRRMELFTMEEPYSPEPYPWASNLAIHEQRHLAQMQFGCGRPWKPGNIIFGQLFPGLMSGLYPGPALLEGDAVVAETALTSSGRGRTASFLNYMRAAFDNGDWRDYWKWVYGSQRYYAPDYYRAGYMLVAGMRTAYNDPDFTKDYFYRVNSGLRFFNLQKTVKAASGERSFKAAFSEIEKKFADDWASSERERAPFIESEPVMPFAKRHTVFSGLTSLGDGLFAAVRSGISSPSSLVVIDTSGRVLCSRPFSERTSRLYADRSGRRIYWSEERSGTLWRLASKSDIYYISYSVKENGEPELSGPVRFAGSERLTCPVPSPDGQKVAAVGHPYEGGTKLLVFDKDGKTLYSHYFASGIQLLEPCWLSDRLYVSGIKDGGAGIWLSPGEGEGDFEEILAPRHATIESLSAFGERLSYISDADGSMELYSLDPGSGDCRRLTSTAYGLSSPVFYGGFLYYTMLGLKGFPEAYRSGAMIYRTTADDLQDKRVPVSEISPVPIAEELSSQERALGNLPVTASAYDLSGVEVSEPERYSRLGHALRIHSWAPFYFDYDNISSLSSDALYSELGVGLTVLFQNDLGNFYGSAGYQLVGDNDFLSGSSELRNAGHLRLTYKGLPIAMEGSLDVNEREAFRHDIYAFHLKTAKDSLRIGFVRSRYAKAHVLGRLRFYLPLDFSRHGWSSGFIPSLTYNFDNDYYSGAINNYEVSDLGSLENKKYMGETGYPDSHGTQNQFTLAARAYAVRPLASSQVYPSFGLGAEAGWRTRIKYEGIMPPSAYFYVYGYLPGLFLNQGLRLTAMGQEYLKEGTFWKSNTVNTVPRGFFSSELDDVFSAYTKRQLKLTADYAIPIWIGDISALSPIAYIRNFVLTPHFDLTAFRWSSHSFLPNGTGVIWSAGASFTLRLGNFLWLPYETSIGLDYCYNGGKDYTFAKGLGADCSRSRVSFIFQISL